ncbi:MAG: 3-oxo-tetronate kinase [Pseudomonadota bacterium]
MTTFLGCIADDFTGATDLAALLARSGVPVSLRLDLPTDPPEPADLAPIEVIALKCRTAPVAEAVTETRAALAWLQRAGAQRFFWKYCSTFDSTAEGNIGPVAEALMADLGADRTIYCPAFPENGRSIFMGNLFVGEQPLAESPMKDHPLTPMRDSNLMRLLQPQVSKPVGLVNRLTVAEGSDPLRERIGTLAAEGTAHIVVDAVANEDLRVIAEACHDLPLLTGGSAIAMPLPKLYREAGHLDAAATSSDTEVPDGGAIVLSGSCSAMTRKQVAKFAATHPAYKLDPVTLSDEGTGAAHAWLAAQPDGRTAMVYATAEPEDVQKAQSVLGTAKAGEIVEQALAEIAIATRDRGTRRFVVAGGETSGAVSKALAVTRLAIGREIAPGVPWTYTDSAGARIALALKSGNFGGSDFFAEALDLLDRQ